MVEYQITYWREIPSMIVFKHESETVKSMLPNRFQEAIDEAAMRLGAIDSDAYLAGWTKSEWFEQAGDLSEISAKVVEDIESKYSAEKITELLEKI
jgi:hypothetical protein